MFSLTRQEKLILIILPATILLGLALNYALKKYPRLDGFYRCASLSLSKASWPININEAGIEQLQELPGVGRHIASLIIEYRKTHEGFKNKEELKDIRGIGEKKFQNIKERVTIKSAE